MWTLPSRGRPELITHFFDMALKAGLQTPGVVILEKSDPKFQRYLDEVKLPKDWHFFVCPEGFENDPMPSFGKATRCWIAHNQEYWNECKWLGSLNDDYEPISQDWDIRLIGQLNGYNFVSGSDRWKAPERLTAAPVYSGDLLRAVGYMFPAGMHHFFFDDVWEMLAVDRGIWDIQMDVIILHNHHMLHKKLDDTSKYVEHDSDFFEKDRATFKKWLEGDYLQALLRIEALKKSKLGGINADQL